MVAVVRMQSKDPGVENINLTVQNSGVNDMQFKTTALDVESS